MAALVAAIHFPEAMQGRSASGKWVAGTSPAMTTNFNGRDISG
jgi:hypothetical protein